ncbi:hypothetical protein DDB_G0275297 [Dictyostelium discoideum AX4]|uniref:PQ-loop repeat-containing protein n=1 Tax=Dictyostelium discoideum TaxID=44689 RepID=Q86I56_DICDI|nr:hypothetical protein DDB_G0275297 [Dictyostelium discoideum AX4]EAL69929.1 hypothetical protein DDB_G0275297 [Dictyostelium discoideum AX4]|eukprot:XP_643841.1 hypothetical protein DDB_G0275297 [Dictyostelium discoideum AX4]
MSSKYCINGTIDPSTTEEFEGVIVDMNIGGVLLGIFLLVGCCFSIIPQHIKIVKTKSVVGLSFLWMFLGNINQFSGFINMFVLKFPQVQACSTLGFARCGPSLLSLFQSFGIWLFSFPIYILYLIFAPNDLKFIEKTSLKDLSSARKEYRLAQLFFLMLVMFLSSIILVVGILVSDIVGTCTHTTYIFGYGMGMLSTIITFVQWSPQIYKTIRDKAVGSFSIIMLCIQGPGSLINLYYLIFVSKESVSTWLAYLCSSVQIFILLGLLIFFDRRNKRIARELKESSIEEQDIHSGSPNQSVLNYKETHPLLFTQSPSLKSQQQNNNNNNNNNSSNQNQSKNHSILNSSFNSSYHEENDREEYSDQI